MSALFLSPHLDDVAFSCAGVLRDHRERGEPTLVVTVFAGPAPPGHALQGRWEARIAEDVAAMAVLDSELVHLTHRDAPFRPEIERWAQIWGHEPSVPFDLAPVEAEVVALWRARGEPVVYAPLGVGSHIDHLHVFAVGAALARAGATVWYYEDFPYAARSDLLTRRLRALGDRLRPVAIDVTPHLARRIEASSCYRSQLDGLFGEGETIATAIAAFVAQRGGECLWR